ncbi:MAG: UBA/THIF-type binding protein [Armatimonadetes bacterium]|jgi:molybdopterin/thiamine biosynthesis adenylyltransferase|nr:UBA/THIF-type binding protein [Armatimonadota bacterium]
MHGQLHHERAYRGAEAMARLASARIVLCGAGAVGSNLAENLMRQGAAHLRVIDRDRVEEQNLGTQVWEVDDIGLRKAEALQNALFRATCRELDAVPKELDARNARRLLSGADLVVDGFDNHASRALVQAQCAAAGLPCLHVGLNADYAEVIWNDGYRVPSDVAGDVCDYPLARNLVLLAVVVATEAIHAFLEDGRQESWTITLRDLAVRRFAG